MKSSFYGMICFLSKNLNLPYKDYERFLFSTIWIPRNAKQCSDSVKMTLLCLLIYILQIATFSVCSQETIFGGVEGLCILLRRLAYPCQYNDLVQRFDRTVPEI